MKSFIKNIYQKIRFVIDDPLTFIATMFLLIIIAAIFCLSIAVVRSYWPTSLANDIANYFADHILLIWKNYPFKKIWRYVLFFIFGGVGLTYIIVYSKFYLDKNKFELELHPIRMRLINKIYSIIKSCCNENRKERYNIYRSITRPKNEEQNPNSIIVYPQGEQWLYVLKGNHDVFQGQMRNCVSGSEEDINNILNRKFRFDYKKQLIRNIVSKHELNDVTEENHYRLFKNLCDFDALMPECYSCFRPEPINVIENIKKNLEVMVEKAHDENSEEYKNARAFLGSYMVSFGRFTNNFIERGFLS